MTDEPAERGDVAAEAPPAPAADGEPAARPGRRPSPGRTPGAAAASRARRIGGAARPPASGTAPTVSVVKTPGANGTASASASAVQPATRPRTAPAPAPTPGPGAAPGAPGWLRWLPALVLTAAALAMAAFFAVASHGVWWARPSANAVRDEVLAAAKTCVVAANSYSYKDFAAAEQKGAACTTGPQTQRYRDAMAALEPKAAKLKAIQVAQVNSAGVSQISQDGTQWTVLVFGQLSVHAVQTGAKGRIDPFGAVVRMDHVGGKWLMSSIDTVSSPTG